MLAWILQIESNISVEHSASIFRSKWRFVWVTSTGWPVCFPWRKTVFSRENRYFLLRRLSSTLGPNKSNYFSAPYSYPWWPWKRQTHGHYKFLNWAWQWLQMHYGRENGRHTVSPVITHTQPTSLISRQRTGPNPLRILLKTARSKTACKILLSELITSTSITWNIVSIQTLWCTVYHLL